MDGNCFFLFNSCFVMKEIITMESGANKQIHSEVISSIFNVKDKEGRVFMFMIDVHAYNLFIRTSING